MSGIGMIGRPGPWAGSMVAAVAVASAGVAASAAPATGRPAMPFAVRPSGASLATAYVVNSSSNSVTPINTATNKAGKAIKVGRQPTAIAITPNGATAYVVNTGSNSVTPISTATNRAGPPVAVGRQPMSIATGP